MHTDQLAYFLHVADTGSINATAQNFYISQQAINAQLKKLEEEIGVQLLNRSSKGITLTPQGELFIPYAKNILKLQDDAVHELHRFSKNEANLVGSLSIFTASVFSDLFLPAVISNFMRMHPNTTIRIMETYNEEVLSYLFRDYCEIVLLSAGNVYIEKMMGQEATGNIKRLNLLDDTQVVCARPDHPLMRYKVLDSDIMEKQYAKEKYLFSLYQVLPLSMPEVIYQEAVSTSSNVELHKKLIWEGNVVTYMPKLAYLHKFQKDGLAAVPITDAYEISHCLIYKDDPNSEADELLHCFLGFIQKQFERRFGSYIEKE